MPIKRELLVVLLLAIFGSIESWIELPSVVSKEFCHPSSSINLHLHKENDQPWSLEFSQTPRNIKGENWTHYSNIEQCSDTDCPRDPFFAAKLLIREPVHVIPEFEWLGEPGFYKLHLERKIWVDALAKCHLEGGHLAIINSDKEAKLLAEYFARYLERFLSPNDDAPIIDYALIGFHDLFGEQSGTRNFYTIKSEPLEDQGYEKWAVGQPENDGQHCGALRNTGLLDVVRCDKPAAFICEAEQS